MGQVHSIDVADKKVLNLKSYKSMSNNEFDAVFNYTYIILYKRLYSIDCDEHNLHNIGKLIYTTLGKKVPKYVHNTLNEEMVEE